MIHARTRGFTLLEVLIAMLIMMALVFVSLEVFKNMLNASSLRVATQEVHAALIDARNSTLASRDDTVYGVHFSSTTVTRFVGSTYNAGSPSNETYRFEGEVTATGTLITAGTNIVFVRLTGIPSATGTIFLQNVTRTSTSSITIHGSGLIEN